MKAGGDVGHRRGPREPARRLTQGWSPLRHTPGPERPTQPDPGSSTPGSSTPGGRHRDRRVAAPRRPLPPGPPSFTSAGPHPDGRVAAALHRRFSLGPPPGKRSTLRWYAATIAAGLAVLVVWYVVGTTGRTEPVQDRQLTAAVPPPASAPALDCANAAAAPGSAGAALEAFMRAEATGESSVSYALLTSSSRARYPTPGAWVAARPNRLRPAAFCLRSVRSVATDAVEFEVAATHRSSLDPFVGLVPARSNQHWLVHRERAGWKVPSGPQRFEYLLPGDQTAAQAASAWVERLASCDPRAAQTLQAARHLYGPADLPVRPCRERGRWTAGAALTLDHAAEAQTLLAAFGSDVLTWGRVVPVRGPRSHFYAALAPIGEEWRVMGVLSDGEGG